MPCPKGPGYHGDDRLHRHLVVELFRGLTRLLGLSAVLRDLSLAPASASRPHYRRGSPALLEGDRRAAGGVGGVGSNGSSSWPPAAALDLGPQRMRRLAAAAQSIETRFAAAAHRATRQSSRDGRAVRATTAPALARLYDASSASPAPADRASRGARKPRRLIQLFQRCVVAGGRHQEPEGGQPTARVAAPSA